MSDLKPLGASIELNGVERHLLFTLNSIEALEDYYDKPMIDILKVLTSDTKDRFKTMRKILTVLLDDECQRELFFNNKEIKPMTEAQVGWLITPQTQTEIFVKILQAYGISIPDKDEEDEKN